MTAALCVSVPHTPKEARTGKKGHCVLTQKTRVLLPEYRVKGTRYSCLSTGEWIDGAVCLYSAVQVCSTVAVINYSALEGSFSGSRSRARDITVGNSRQLGLEAAGYIVSEATGQMVRSVCYSCILFLGLYSSGSQAGIHSGQKLQQLTQSR